MTSRPRSRLRALAGSLDCAALPARAAIVSIDATTAGCGAAPSCFATRAAAAAQPCAQTCRSSFTRARAATLDFVTEDYFPSDNAGGMSLSVTAVPEPPVWALAGLGLLRIGAARRRLAPR